MLELNMPASISYGDVFDLVAATIDPGSPAIICDGDKTDWKTFQARSDARARRLLELDTPLAQIAVQCGFSDESAFSRAFKSWTGVPPLKWRKTHRKTFSDASLG